MIDYGCSFHNCSEKVKFTELSMCDGDLVKVKEMDKVLW